MMGFDRMFIIAFSFKTFSEGLFGSIYSKNGPSNICGRQPLKKLK